GRHERIAEAVNPLGVDDGDACGRLRFLLRSARGGDDDLIGVDGGYGHVVLLLTNVPSQRDSPPVIGDGGPTLHGWTRPEKRTTDRGRFLTSPDGKPAYSCGHSAGIAPASL